MPIAAELLLILTNNGRELAPLPTLGGIQILYRPVLRLVVSGRVPPTLVAAESVPSMLLGVLVLTSAVPLLPQALSSSAASKKAAGATESLNVDIG